MGQCCCTHTSVHVSLSTACPVCVVSAHTSRCQHAVVLPAIRYNGNQMLIEHYYNDDTYWYVNQFIGFHRESAREH